VSRDDIAGTAVTAGLCPRSRREIRRTIRHTARTLRRDVGPALAGVITCRIYDDPDEIRRVLAVCYADPSPGELALIDQYHAHLNQHPHRWALVVATCHVTDNAGGWW
jgi:hypothetical protein